MIRRVITAVAVLVWSGCNTEAPQAAPSPAPQQRMQAPWLLDVQGTSPTSGTTVLTASIQGTLVFPSDVEVFLELPEGVALHNAERSWLLPAGTSPPWTREIVLHGDTKAALHTNVVAHLATSSMGWHARKAAVPEQEPELRPQPDARSQALLKKVLHLP